MAELESPEQTIICHVVCEEIGKNTSENSLFCLLNPFFSWNPKYP